MAQPASASRRQYAKDDESTAGRRLFNRHTWCARHLT